jgi:hypothetical protein
MSVNDPQAAPKPLQLPQQPAAAQTPLQTPLQTPQAAPLPFAEPSTPPKLVLAPPLVRLRDRERSLRQRTVTRVQPWLNPALARTLTQASSVADASLDELATVDLARITNRDLRAARLNVGFLCVGFSALLLLLLVLYLQSLEPGDALPVQISHHWFQYISLVGLGVAGMFMLGREAMRPPITLDEPSWGGLFHKAEPAPPEDESSP